MGEMKLEKSRLLLAVFIVGMFLVGGFLAIASDVPGEDAGQPKSRMTYPPNPPVLVAPRNGEKGITESSVILQWQGSPKYRGATRDDGIDHQTIDAYWVKVSTQGPPNSDSAYGDVFDGQVGQTTSKMISVEPGVKYYWAVKAHDYDGWSAWSSHAVFSTNSPPEAEIDLVSPSPAREGQEVSFKGTATDPDGDEITAYEWTSSLEADPLGDKPSIKVSDLEVGEHVIRFRAKDANGIWSDYAEFTLTVNKNTPPTQVTSISPQRTHDLQPEITWPASRDDEGDEITYHISIGTSQAVPNDIENDFQTTLNRYKFSKKLSYGEDGESKEYYVSIWCEDEYGAKSNTFQGTIEIYNTKPEAPSVAIMPMEAYSDNDLAVSITKEANDPDGDEVTYSYRWYKQDSGSVAFIPQSSLNDQQFVPSRMTQPGDVWRVEVIPNDGIIDGEKGVAEITIKNRDPVPEITAKADGKKLKDADEDDDGEPDDENEDGIPDETVLTDTTITFDASGSTDPDGEDLSFEWDFGDEETDDGPKVEHAYSEPDTYTVTLTVTDSSGGEATMEFMVVVVYPPPDLKVVPLSDVNIGVHEGDTISMLFAVKNIGDGPAEEYRVKVLGPDGQTVFTKTGKDLAPGKETKVQASVAAQHEGVYRVVVEDTEGQPLGSGTAYNVNFVKEPEPGIIGKTAEEDKQIASWIVAIIVFLIIVLFAVVWMIRKKRMEYYEDYYDEEDEEDEDEGYAPALGGMYGAPGLGMGGAGAMGMPGMGYGAQPGMPGMGYGQYAALPPTGYGAAGMYGAPGAAPALPAAGMGGAQPMMPQDMGQVPALPKPEEHLFKSKSPPPQPPGAEFGITPEPTPTPAPTGAEEMPLLPEGRGDAEGTLDVQTTIEQPAPSTVPEAAPAPDAGAGIGEGGDSGLKCPYCGAPIEEGWLVCVNCKAMLK